MHNIQICKDNHYAYTYMNNMQEFATLHKSIGETQEEEMLNNLAMEATGLLNCIMFFLKKSWLCA